MDSPWSPMQLVENSTMPSLLLIAYFFGCGVNIANYVGYFRYHNDVYGTDLPRAYLAFVIIGTGTYILFSGTMWLWAAKYASTREERADKLRNGIWAIFFLKDMPLFIAEYHAILCCGWLNGYQGFAFIFQLLFALFSFIFTWLSITWRGSEWLQVTFGGVQGLKTGTEQIVIFSPPPAMGSQKFVPAAAPVSDVWTSPFPANDHGLQYGGRQAAHFRQREDSASRQAGYVPPTPVPLRRDETLSRQMHVPTPREMDTYHRDRFHAELERSNSGRSHSASPNRYLVVPEQHGTTMRSTAEHSSPSRAFSPQEPSADMFFPSPFRGLADVSQRSPGGTAVTVERHVF
jgi:hypothetical protein